MPSINGLSKHAPALQIKEFMIKMLLTHHLLFQCLRHYFRGILFKKSLLSEEELNVCNSNRKERALDNVVISYCCLL